jgi:rRNA biogenesis protein RRP5
MSLKKTVIDPTLKKLDYSDLTPGMRVTGIVKNIQPFGIFINIDDSSISGLCHISEVNFL